MLTSPQSAQAVRNIFAGQSNSPLIENLEPRLMLAGHLDGLAGQLVFDSGLSVVGDLVLDSDGDITFAGPVNVSGNIVIHAGGAIRFDGQLQFGGAALLVGQEVDFAGGESSVVATGSGGVLTIESSADAVINIGGQDDFDLAMDLTDSDLAAMSAGLGSIIIGRPDSCQIVIESAMFATNVDILGRSIVVQDSLAAAAGKAIDLSGGSVTVAGQITSPGGRVNIESAQITKIAADGMIDVSGEGGGNAGSIRLMSGSGTLMAGSVLARGSQSGGDGGFIEVSSAGNLALPGNVDTSAPAGRAGMLLIDPKNVVIGLADHGWSETDFDGFGDLPGLDVSLSVAKLLTWGDVTILANNDITVNSAIDMGVDNSLTLRAGRSIFINANITSQDQPITIIANDPAADPGNRDPGAAEITMADGTRIDAGTGEIWLTISAGDDGTAGAITFDEVSGGGMYLSSFDSFVEAGAGDVDNDFIGGVLVLTVTGTGGAIGTELTPISTDIEVLRASTYDGGIYISEADGVIITEITALEGGLAPYVDSSGQIVLDSRGTVATIDAVITAGGDVVVGQLTAADTLTLNVAGAIYDLNQADHNLLAGKANIQSDGDFGQSTDPIEMTVGAITASSMTGSIYIYELHGPTLESITADGDVVVSVANGSVMLKEITAGGAVTIDVSNGGISDGNADAVNITADSADLSAKTAIGTAANLIETNVAGLAVAVSEKDGGIYVSETDSLSSLAVTTNNGNVTVNFTGGSLTFVPATGLLNADLVGTHFAFSNTGGGLSIGTINAGNGDVSLSASGAITDDVNDLVVDITGAAVTLAGTAVGAAADHLDTSADSLNATASAGGVFILESNTLLLAASAAGSGSDIEVTVTAGDLTLEAVTAPDDVSLSAGGSIIDGNGSAINITGKLASLAAGGAIGDGDAVEASVNTATAAAAAGALALANNKALTVSNASATGDLSISAGGNLTIGQINAAGATATLTSTAAIIDGNGAALNITANAAVLSGSKVGTVADPVETTVATLTADTTTGGIYVVETDGLIIDRATALGAGSNIQVSTGGNIALGSITAAGDEVVLAAATSVTDNNGPAINVTARKLTITAPDGIGVGDPLELAVDELNANGGTGGGEMVNSGNLALTDASLEGKGGANVSYTADSITVLNMADNMATIGAGGSVILRAMTGDVVFLDLNDTIQTSGAGSITIEALGAGAVAIVGNLITANQDISVSADGNIVIGQLNAGSGDVTVASSHGVIVDGNGAAINIIASTANLSAAAPTARQAELITMWAIADATALRSEAAAKLSSADSFASGAAITAAAQSNAAQVLATAQVDVASKQATAASEASQAQAMRLAADIADGISAGLTIASDVVLVVASIAQAIPLTGDGGAFSVAAGIMVAADVAAAVAYGLGIAADAAENEAQDAAAEWLAAQCNEYAAQQDLDLAISVAQAFQEGSSIASAAAAAAAIARDHAAVVANWAIVAEDQVNAIGTEASSLAVQADEINAAAASGSIYISVSGDFDLGDMAAGPGGSIVIDASGDIVVVGTITAPQLVWLNAANRILDGGGQVVAGQFLAEAATYIGTTADPIETQVDQLAADGGAGGVFINNSTAVAVTQLGSVNGIIAAGNVLLDSVGSITILAPIVALGQTVTLNSTAGSIIDSHNGTDITAATLAATALSGIAADTAVDSVTATTTGPGAIDLADVDALILTSVQSANGPIAIAAGGPVTATSVVSLTDNDANDITINSLGGSIAIDAVNAGAAGDVTLAAAGAISTNAGGRVTADSLTADAAGNIDLTTTANSVDMAVAGVGDIVLNELDALTVTAAETAGGSIDITTGGAIVVGQVAASDGADDVTLNSAEITMAPGGRISADLLTADALAGMTLTTAVASADLTVLIGGAIDVQELDAIDLLDVDTISGSITVTAGGTITATNVDSSATDNDGNDISLTATNGGSIVLGAVNAGTLANDVTLDSANTISMVPGGRVTADVLTADAVHDITMTTTVNSADVSISDNGDITVTELNDITLADLDTTGSDITVTAGGAIVVGDVNAANGLGDVTLDAGATISMAPGGRITANLLTADSVAGQTLTTTVATTDLSVSGTGDIFVNELDAITLADMDTADGSIDVTAGGAIVAGDVNAADGAAGANVTLDSGADVTMALGGRITADLLTVDAVTGQNLVTTVATADLTVSGAGNIAVDELDAILLADVDTADGSIDVTAGGAIVAGDVNAADGADDVTLDSGAAVTMAPGGRITADLLTVDAAAGQNLVTTVATADLTVSGTGNIVVDEFDAIVLADVDTADGSIDVTAGGPIVAGDVNAADGAAGNNVTLDSGDAISMSAGGLITADLLTADAVTGMAVQTAAAAADLSVLAAGNIDVTELDTVDLLDVDTADGSITVVAGGTITATDVQSSATDDDDNDISLTATDGGDLVLGVVNAGTLAGDVTLDAAGAILMLPAGRVTADVLTADAVDGQLLTTTVNSADLTVSATGSIDLDEADDILLADVDTADGSIAVVAGGTISVNDVNAADGGCDVLLASTGGSIIEAVPADAEADIVADNLVMTASAGIGAAAQPIEIAAAALEAAGGAAGVYLTDLADGLTIGGATAGLTGVTATGGNVVITAMSPLTIDEPVSNSGGNVVLAAAGTAGNDNLTVNAAVTASGDVTLNSADDVELNAAAAVTASGTVFVIADQGDDDPGVGSRIDLAGPVTANALNVASGDDADELIINDATVSSTTIATGGGDDLVTVAPGNTLGAGLTDLGAGNDTLDLASTINNVAGNDGDDLLMLHAGGRVAGDFDGGDGYDQVVYDHDGLDGNDYVGDVNVNLETMAATSVAAFANVERFESTNAAADTIFGPNAGATWNVTGGNAGNIGGAGVFDFLGFGNLTGGDGDDTFSFADGGSLSGDMAGGAGDDLFQFAAGASSANSIAGGAGQDTFRLAAGAALAANLDGGADSDSFQFGAGANLTGDLTGGLGSDTVDYDTGAFSAVATVVLDSADSGTTTGVSGQFTSVEQVIGDAGFASQNSITGYDAAVVWNSTGLNSGNIDGLFFFVNFGTLSGSDGDETIIIDDGGLPDGPIDGGDGLNALDLSGWTGDVMWIITGENAGTVITAAGTFTFTGITWLVGSAGDDTFIFTDGAFLTEGLDGGDGEDRIDFTPYTTQNVWTGELPAGTVETAKGNFDYINIEDILGGLVTTFRFSMIDLIGTITRVILPAEIVGGARGRVDLAITNDSNTRIVDRVDVAFYLSLDNTLGAGDIQIAGVADFQLNRLPGRSRTCSASVAVPEDAPAGVYNILAVIDSAEAIEETDELNNVVVSGTQVRVIVPTQDLSAEFIRMSLPTDGLPGDSGAISLRVSNNGNTVVTTPVRVDLFLSQDDVIDGSDILLRSIENWPTGIQPNAGRTLQTTVSIPDGTPAGSYNVLARVDAAGQVGESDELNNDAMAATQVTVATPTVDLMLTAGRVVLPKTAVPGDRGRFEVTVSNLGNAPVRSRIGIDIYASVDGVLDGDDILVASVNNASLNLASGKSANYTLPVTLKSDLLPGTYQWLAVIDSDAAVAESNEANNIQPVVAAGTELVWKFGDFDGRRDVRLKVNDTNGTPVTFALSGNGCGSVLGGPDFDEIVIVGTNQSSRVNILTPMRAVTQANNLTLRQPLGVFMAPTLDVLGTLTMDGPVRRFMIHNG